MQNLLNQGHPGNVNPIGLWCDSDYLLQPVGRYFFGSYLSTKSLVDVVHPQFMINQSGTAHVITNAASLKKVKAEGPGEKLSK